jgi:dihydroflavonol-4-reductase
VGDRVYVTGGTGFVGGALVRRLLERGDEVVALARSEEGAQRLAAAGARPARGDVLDEAGLAAGMAGCRIAYHVAGVNRLCPPDPAPLWRVNVDGARAAARAAARAGVARLVHTSSAATLGEAKGTVGREDSPHRGTYLSTYEETKVHGERAVLAVAAETGLDVVCLNPTSVQGPGRTGGTGRILLAMLDGRLKVFIQTRISIVDIADCVDAHLLAAERGRPGERYVLSGVTLTSAQAFDVVARVSGRPIRPRIVPGAAAWAAGGLAEAAGRLLRRRPPLCREMVRTLLHGHAYDGSRAERELGLAYTPVQETLRRTLEWAAAQGLVRRRSSPAAAGAAAG